MHLAALKHVGRKGDYRLIDVTEDKLDEQLASMHRQGYTGFNVTIPHKRAIYARCIGKSEEALQVSAVNTVKIHPDGKMVGHNTDLPAFKQTVSDKLGNRKRDSAIILGAGGAARAAVVGLCELGFSEITILVRNPESYDISEFYLQNRLIPHDTFKILKVDQFFETQPVASNLIVNSTPLGQSGGLLPPWVDYLFRASKKDTFFYDMVYARSENITPLMQLALSHELESTDGTAMLVGQAALAFEYWTGKSVPPDVMLTALKAQLAASK